MQIGHICSNNVVTCSSNTTVLEAAQLMRRNHVGTLIVVEEVNGMLVPHGRRFRNCGKNAFQGSSPYSHRGQDGRSGWYRQRGRYLEVPFEGNQRAGGCHYAPADPGKGGASPLIFVMGKAWNGGCMAVSVFMEGKARETAVRAGVTR